MGVFSAAFEYYLETPHQGRSGETGRKPLARTVATQRLWAGLYRRADYSVNARQGRQGQCYLPRHPSKNLGLCDLQPAWTRSLLAMLDFPFGGSLLSSHEGVYRAVNEVVLSLVPQTASRILDLGCGAGDLGDILRRGTNREIVGVTYSSREAEIASNRLSSVHCADLNNLDFDSLGQFDCVILSHVLEHLYNPLLVLERLKAALTRESVVIIALPNVLWCKQRLQFMVGRWRYEDSGILDRTHFRFFDRYSAGELLHDAGYHVVRRIDDGYLPALKPVRSLLGTLATDIDRIATKTLPGLFAFQFVFLARPNTINE